MATSLQKNIHNLATVLMCQTRKNKGFFFFFTLVILSACNPIQKPQPEKPINRQEWVSRHNPQLAQLDAASPFTLGNGQFAFTADVTGLQTFYPFYFEHGIPTETKAKWAWHERPNPNMYRLQDANETYHAYGKNVAFPTNMTHQAGQWLRKNPHDLPLFQLGLAVDGKPLERQQIKGIQQTLDMWKGQLNSAYQVNGVPIRVTTFVCPERDEVVARIQTPKPTKQTLSVNMRFPRGYDLATKNNPAIIFEESSEHQSVLLEKRRQYVLIERTVDSAKYFILVRWAGDADVQRIDHHYFSLSSRDPSELTFSVEALQQRPTEIQPLLFNDELGKTHAAWQAFWQSGAAVSFTGSTDPRAQELERRIVLSRYLMAVQSRADIPPQETGLTSSSWYGKHHSEMTYWHTAHWILWGNPEIAQKTLDWYLRHLDTAKALAQYRGLEGARWAKMVGPKNRESPGGNPLIIWNQPQLIHLAELLFQRTQDEALLTRYQSLVEESAKALSSMLTWDEPSQRYNLSAPIWIAQEIYAPKKTHNPSFELAYWHTGLRIAQAWRQRLQLPPNLVWQKQIELLSPLPTKDGKYVAIESIPDTFDNRESRKDHPTMLAPFGMLNDPRVDQEVMSNTLDAVLESWDWQEKIWGWDYPMIAMTAARLEQPDQAVDMLLADLNHNIYLNNGHVPQAGASLPVYLPANGALLTAVAMMLGGWQGAPEHPWPGFPSTGGWQIQAEHFHPMVE